MNLSLEMHKIIFQGKDVPKLGGPDSLFYRAGMGAGGAGPGGFPALPSVPPFSAASITPTNTSATPKVDYFAVRIGIRIVDFLYSQSSYLQ